MGVSLPFSSRLLVANTNNVPFGCVLFYFIWLLKYHYYSSCVMTFYLYLPKVVKKNNLNLFKQL
jgi:hypothetical protein